MSKKRTIILWSSFLLLSMLSILILYGFSGSIYLGADIDFHKARIDGLAQAIQHGDLFSKINYAFLNGKGYATGIFYPEFFLLFPALLKVFGLSLSSSYVVFMIGITFLTFISSFYTRFSIDKKFNNSVLCSLLYTFSAYRLTDVYSRAAVGEYIALLFLPLAFYGIYHIFYGESKKWYWLTIGMVCLIGSHLITSLLVAITIFLLLLLNSKVLLQEKGRVVDLGKATLTTIPLVLSIIIPIIEQISYQGLILTESAKIQISNMTFSISDWLTFNLINQPAYATLGLLPCILLVITLMNKKKLQPVTKHFAILTFIYWVFVVNIFPWGIFDSTFINAIQFPWRFYTIAILMLSFVISFDDLGLLKNKWLTYILYAYPILTVIVYQVMLLGDPRMVSYSKFNDFYDNKPGFGQEYLPSSTSYKELSKLTDDEFPVYTKGSITNYEKSYNTITFDYDFKDSTEVTLPFVNYKGYVATIKGLDKGTTGLVKVTESLSMDGLIAVNLDGKSSISVTYRNTSLQNISLVFSSLTLIYFGGFVIKQIKRVDE